MTLKIFEILYMYMQYPSLGNAQFSMWLTEVESGDEMKEVFVKQTSTFTTHLPTTGKLTGSIKCLYTYTI